MEEIKIKSVIESMLFIWGEPLQIKQMAEVLEQDKKLIYRCVKELQNEYLAENKGIQIIQVNNAFQLSTNIENYSYIEKLCTPTKAKKMSQPALETLAIVAYKQPATRGEIEEIRGIKCESVLSMLMEKNFIEEQGRLNKIGKPILYGTTDKFLKQFGFSKLDDLPEIETIDRMINLENEIDDPTQIQMKLDVEQ